MVKKIRYLSDFVQSKNISESKLNVNVIPTIHQTITGRRRFYKDVEVERVDSNVIKNNAK